MFERIVSRLHGPGAGWFLAGFVAVAFAAGIVFWGGFNWAMELSNTETFCISCHEMRDNVYAEIKSTVHFSNRTGVRAVCADCHVPKDWVHKLGRKIRATNELYHKIVGTVSTTEKFNAARTDLAKSVWTTMRASDSRECRNCHSFESMDEEKQVRPAKRKHAQARQEGLTCIDCHQGVAHKLPADWEKAWAEVAGK
jgi:cytochrome c-type protein NapC